jgi:hypothetical protein
LGKTPDEPQEQRQTESRAGETGPWTLEEAFLLFDWWPPEMERPEYWQAAEEAPARGKMPAINQGFAGITTARQFLRDDMNVL